MLCESLHDITRYTNSFLSIDEFLGDLLHSMMYIGGTITNQPFAANPDYLLVGLEL